MKITLSPIPCARDTVLTVSGQTLTIDGVPFDLTAIPDGAEATDEDPASPFIGVIRRVAGQIVCTVRYAYDATTADQMQSTDWADYTFDVKFGTVPDPMRRKAPEPAFTPEDAA
jgi:hypothetical protein